MKILGHVKDGVVVLDDAVILPEGTAVSVEPVTTSKSSLADRLGDLIGAAPELPADMAENHDHYLHGAPKR